MCPFWIPAFAGTTMSFLVSFSAISVPLCRRENPPRIELARLSDGMGNLPGRDEVPFRQKPFVGDQKSLFSVYPNSPLSYPFKCMTTTKPGQCPFRGQNTRRDPRCLIYRKILWNNNLRSKMVVAAPVPSP